MDASSGNLTTRDWPHCATEFQGADPSRLPVRKLVAEACIVDLLAPMLAETSPIPEHLDQMARAGWCGWSAGPSEGDSWVAVPDERTLSRYAAELRNLTQAFLEPLLSDLILRLFRDRAQRNAQRALNATAVKRLLFPRLPWIHRELVNAHMSALAQAGWLHSTTRGYRLPEKALERTLPPISPEVALAELFQDVYPALMAYVDLQPGSVAGRGDFIATPDRLMILADAIDSAIGEAARDFEIKAKSAPDERRVVLRLHRLLAPADEAILKLPEDVEARAPIPEEIREDANAEARLIAPFVAAAVLPGWGDPQEAWCGLKGALAAYVQQQCQELPGGLYRAAHRRHGLGSGTLASYLDGPRLISRNNGKIKAVKEGEVARMERETLFLLSKMHPESQSERWLWEQVKESAEVLMYREYRVLLAKLAREGYLLMSNENMKRFYRTPRPYQSMPVEGMWRRWQKLWHWLPALRSVSRTIRHGSPGATLGGGQWVVDREDLPTIEVQIQRTINELSREEAERCAHLEEVDHLALGGLKNSLIVFTRLEPWLLAQMENL